MTSEDESSCFWNAWLPSDESSLGETVAPAESSPYRSTATENDGLSCRPSQSSNIVPPYSNQSSDLDETRPPLFSQHSVWDPDTSAPLFSTHTSDDDDSQSTVRYSRRHSSSPFDTSSSQSLSKETKSDDKQGLRHPDIESKSGFQSKDVSESSTSELNDLNMVIEEDRSKLAKEWWASPTSSFDASQPIFSDKILHVSSKRSNSKTIISKRFSEESKRTKNDTNPSSHGDRIIEAGSILHNNDPAPASPPLISEQMKPLMTSTPKYNNIHRRSLHEYFVGSDPDSFENDKSKSKGKIQKSSRRYNKNTRAQTTLDEWLSGSNQKNNDSIEQADANKENMENEKPLTQIKQAKRVNHETFHFPFFPDIEWVDNVPESPKKKFMTLKNKSEELNKKSEQKFKSRELFNMDSPDDSSRDAVCACCKDYYDVLGLKTPELSDRFKQVSKHQNAFPMPLTPEHYWDVQMADRLEQNRRGQINETSSQPKLNARHIYYQTKIGSFAALFHSP